MSKIYKVLFLQFFPVFVLLSNAVVLEAQVINLDRPAPQIFFPETTHDFGTISRGDNVSHLFKVRNTGDAPLRLIKAKGS